MQQQSASKLIRLCGGVPIGVPRLADGPDVVAFDQILRTYKVRAFFCNSTFHNPTGAGLSPKIAFAVVERAVEHDFLIVGDVFTGISCLEGDRPLPAWMTSITCVYIGSFPSPCRPPCGSGTWLADRN